MLQTQRSSAAHHPPLAQPVSRWSHPYKPISSWHTPGHVHSSTGLSSPTFHPDDKPLPTHDMTTFYPQSIPHSKSDHDAFPSRRADSRPDIRAAAMPHHSQGYNVSIHGSQPVSRVASRAASPEFQPAPLHDIKRGGTNASIHPYLQLPATISPTGGSLTEFAAQTTCLFWFESSYALAWLEDVSSSPTSRPPLLHTSRPTTGFLKWVTTILSTTQVTQNVVLLALLFIRRLKTLNPTVKGKSGSEYRLLTVALMLGNKFLDDNTYTNKTWAEVSGIAVSEIHVMEVEFLSHMKYNLYTTKEEWEIWHKHLASLWSFFNAPIETVSPSAKLTANRPVLQIPRALPSPPGSTYTSSPYTYSASPAPPTNINTPQSLHSLMPPHLAAAPAVPVIDMHSTPRKRSWDESAHTPLSEPPYKKSFNMEAYASRGSTPTSLTPTTIQSTFPQLPSLPPPHALPTAGHIVASAAPLANPMHSLANVRTGNQSLPGVNWAQTLAPPRNLAHPSAALPASQAFSDRLPTSHGHGQYDASPHRSSPNHVAAYSSAASHTSSQHQLSPSFFLHQRSSPYKPVRDIRTLLGPAASGQLQSKPQSIPQDQMYWQPLGRHHERQAGRVPYLHREAWPESNQFEGWTGLQN